MLSCFGLVVHDPLKRDLHLCLSIGGAEFAAQDASCAIERGLAREVAGKLLPLPNKSYCAIDVDWWLRAI